jgi:phosphonate transport system ATP-binding protein
MMPAQIELDHVTVSYGSMVALDDVSLSIGAGERVAVIGPSGAGKSTLLAVMNGSVLPTVGAARFAGEPIADTDRWRREAGRSIATIPQALHLSGRLRVVHNVNAGRLADWSTPKALWSLVRPRELDEALDALASVGIADKLLVRTDRLSGGERQRVAIARALRQDPTLMLADEPTASLDPARSLEVMELLIDVANTNGRTLVVSQHDVELALRTCDRIVALRSGRVVFDCAARDVSDDAVAALYAIDRAILS